MSATHEPVRWGILSTANINRKFLAGARQAPGVEILAVASRDGERAQAYAREHGIPRAHASYEALLADADVEAVYIPLPNALHVPWSLHALRAGKHVLCEKPLTRHAEEAREAFSVAGELGLWLSEAFMYRHHPQIARVRELLDGGRIGALRAVRSHFSFPISRADDVRLDAALEGGALMDVGCYCVHAARTLAGEPEQVAAVSLVGREGVDVRFAAAMRMPGGVVAHFDAGLDFADRFELEVVGDQGTLRLPDPWHATTPVIEVHDTAGLERLEIEAPNPYGLEAADFSAAIREHRPPLLGGDDAIAQARALEALYRAAERPTALV
jgi:xylose dehydrogenase (NAD/NADP)